jgi:hypothetical protein
LQFGGVPQGLTVAIVVANQTQAFEDIKHLADRAGLFFAFKLCGNLRFCPFAALGAEQVTDDRELVFKLGRPFLLFGRGDRGFVGGVDAVECGLVGGLFGGLVVGSEPADQAVAFFFGALGVEFDEAFEDLVFEVFFVFGVGVLGFPVGDQVVPVVGGEDGAIEIVVDLFEGGDEGAIVILAIVVGEGLACADFFEEVVHAGDGDVGVGGLYGFAVAIELFAEVADGLFLFFGWGGEGEGSEASRYL